MKGVPVRITNAHSVKVRSYPDPDSTQLILGHSYTIKVEVFNKDERPIYPSEVNIYNKKGGMGKCIKTFLKTINSYKICMYDVTH